MPEVLIGNANIDLQRSTPYAYSADMKSIHQRSRFVEKCFGRRSIPCQKE